jgi:hypothetical protein
MDIGEFTYLPAHNDLPFGEPNSSHKASTWDDFVIKARKLMDSGLTEHVSCDVPKQLKIAILFSNPEKTNSIELSITIPRLLKSVPEELKSKILSREFMIEFIKAGMGK